MRRTNSTRQPDNSHKPEAQARESADSEGTRVPRWRVGLVDSRGSNTNPTRQRGKNRSSDAHYRQIARRKLLLEQLEDRSLLAALLPYQNAADHFDVDANGTRDVRDARVLDLALKEKGEGPLAPPNGPVHHFVDVDGNNLLTYADLDLWTRNDIGTHQDSPSESDTDAAFTELGSDSGGTTSSMMCGYSATLYPVGNVNEGQSFSLSGYITPPGSYQIMGGVNWGVSPGSGSGGYIYTNTSGQFSVPHIYWDDGASPGNGTSSDAEDIVLSGTIMGCPVYGQTTGTVNNVAPAPPQFSLFNTPDPLGGPKWKVGVSVQDVGLQDYETVTINWGDGSVPTVVTLLQGHYQEALHEYPPRQRQEVDAEGIPLPYIVTATIVDDDTGGASWGPAGALMYVLDLDNDANNNRIITPSDDPIEDDSPGRFVVVNSDDDNGNYIADFEENPISAEDDLQEFQLAFVPTLRSDVEHYDGWHVTLHNLVPPSTANGVVWAFPDKSGDPLSVIAGDNRIGEWTVGLNAIPESLYLEALSVGPDGYPGEIWLQLRLWTPDWQLVVDTDEVVFTSFAADTDVDLVIFDGQFGPPIPAADEDVTGAVTVANLNDTDADNQPDCCDLDGVVEDRILDDAHGRDERDLMNLVAYRPTGYVPGTSAVLTFSDPDHVFLWKDSTKKNAVVLDAGGTLNITWAAGEGSKEYWIEIVAPSETVANYSITLSYAGKSDLVKATAVWAQNTATYLETKDWADVPADPWKTEMEEGQQENAIFVGGTGVRPDPREVEGNLLFANKVFFQYTVTPINVVETLPRVQFDATRQKEGKVFIKTPAGEIKVDQPDNQELNPVFPIKWEQANDDPSNNREYPVHNDTGHMYHGDRPSISVVAEIAETDPLMYYIRRNFWEWIRVRFTGIRPAGNTLQGSQSSGKFLWHSRITIDRSTGEWKRAGVNDIDEGHVIIGDQP